jgi:hypothetical protein
MPDQPEGSGPCCLTASVCHALCGAGSGAVRHVAVRSGTWPAVDSLAAAPVGACTTAMRRQLALQLCAAGWGLLLSTESSVTTERDNPWLLHCFHTPRCACLAACTLTQTPCWPSPSPTGPSQLPCLTAGPQHPLQRLAPCQAGAQPRQAAWQQAAQVLVQAASGGWIWYLKRFSWRTMASPFCTKM